MESTTGPATPSSPSGSTELAEVLPTSSLVSCPTDSMAFAVGQLAVFQGASDEHI